jgi:hypothetical protein
MLTVEEAVVGGVDDQRALELARRAQRGDDVPNRLVYGKQRLEPLLVVLTDRVQPCGPDQGTIADRRRLVGDIRLVERGRGGQRLGHEGVPVSRRR